MLIHLNLFQEQNKTWTYIACFHFTVTGLLPLNMTIPQATMTCQEKSIEFTDKALAAT